MTVIARQLRKQFDRDLAGIGVTRSQWTAIVVAVSRPGANQRVLAEALDMSEAAAGRLVDRLCAEGLLERHAKEGDKRAYCVSVSEKGTPILERGSALATQLEDNAFRGMDDGEVRQLSSLLDRLYENMNRQGLPTSGEPA